MKKIITLVSLAAVVCACNKNEMATAGYGYIEVAGISNDVSVSTKASQNVTDLSGWTIKVGETAYTGSTQKFAAGTYTVTASNYADEATANASESGWGDAFYTGSKGNVEVTAGSTTNVEIACGTAKNARLGVVFNTSTFGTFITDYSVTVEKSGVDGGLVFNGVNAGAKAYFTAGTTDVAYTIAYKYNGTEKTISDKKITLGAAATEKTITISANSNGTINVTITYDDTFTDGGGDSFDIDAATGEEMVVTD